MQVPKKTRMLSGRALGMMRIGSQDRPPLFSATDVEGLVRLRLRTSSPNGTISGNAVAVEVQVEQMPRTLDCLIEVKVLENVGIAMVDQRVEEDGGSVVPACWSRARHEN